MERVDIPTGDKHQAYQVQTAVSELDVGDERTVRELVGLKGKATNVAGFLRKMECVERQGAPNTKARYVKTSDPRTDGLEICTGCQMMAGGTAGCIIYKEAIRNDPDFNPRVGEVGGIDGELSIGCPGSRCMNG